MASSKNVLQNYKMGRIARNTLFSPEQKQRIKMIHESTKIPYREKAMHLQNLVEEHGVTPKNLLVNGFRNLYAKILEIISIKK